MRILVISDLHAPFAHPDAINFLKRVKKEYKTNGVICIGDLGDQHGWSRHDREPDAPGQGDEDAACVQFCRELYSVFPFALACVGNHDKRLAKACVRTGVPRRLHRSIAEVYDSPDGWKWGDGHECDGVIYQHGEGFSGQNAALRAAQINRCSTVIGHIHAWAGVQFHSNGINTIFGMNVGCLADPSSLAMNYAKTSPNKQVLGCGVVIEGHPIFVPLS